MGVVKTANRNGSIEYARFLGALGIVWFHMKMPGGTTALAALQLFVLIQVYFGAERALPQQARRILIPWVLWSVIYAVCKIIQAWLQGNSLSDEFESWMLLTGPSIHLWYLPFSFLCVTFAWAMLRALPWTLIYLASLLIAAGSLLLANSMFLEIPFAQWCAVIAAATVGLLLKGPVSSRIVMAAFMISLAFAVYVLGWTSGAWQTLVATGVFFIVTEIELSSTPVSKRLSEISFGIYLIHPAIYSVLLLFPVSGTLFGYALVVCISALGVVLLRRFAPILV